MPRKMTLQEFEITMKQRADIVFNNFMEDATKQLQPLVREALADGIDRVDTSKMLDLAMTSIVANMVLQMVHPLGRAHFLESVRIGVENLQAQASKTLPDGKVLIQ